VSPTIAAALRVPSQIVPLQQTTRQRKHSIRTPLALVIILLVSIFSNGRVPSALHSTNILLSLKSSQHVIELSDSSGWFQPGAFVNPISSLPVSSKPIFRLADSPEYHARAFGSYKIHASHNGGFALSSLLKHGSVPTSVSAESYLSENHVDAAAQF